LSLATVLVVIAATHPASTVGRALGRQPLRWIGVRSYGIYLWHYPIIVLTTPMVTRGMDLPRALLQVGASIGVAALSWRFVESPIRRGALGRFIRGARERAWRLREVPARGVLASGGALATIGMCCAALAGAIPTTPAGALAVANDANAATAFGGSGLSLHSLRLPPGTAATNRAPTAAGPVPSTTIPVPTTIPAPTAAGPAPATTGTPSTTFPVSPTDPSAPLRTSCRSVVHLGDSTSESLVSPGYLPDPSQRLAAQYARVGATRAILEIQGATSVVETLDGSPNAEQIARSLVRQGYKGCWVIALGTNDTADVYVGSSVSLADRIQRMMSVIGDQPVLWVTTVSETESGPYSEANMRLWNEALLQACPRYSNMRVLNWAALAEPGWFIADGLHYNSVGSAARAAAFANALAEAFPASTPSTGSAGSSEQGSGPAGCEVL
ncbi:MAG: acyltransferase, partial [Acidimicrobiales bacterium]|nr:acyltransferase [Acidimicrobiales bacterium]